MRRRQGETFLKFVGPLVSDASRRQDQHTFGGGLPGNQLGDNQARLDRLAEPDIVCQQDPRTDTAQDGQRRFELVWQELDCGARRGAKTAWRRVGCEKRSTGAAPPSRRRQQRAIAGGDSLDIVEWCEDLADRLAVGERNELAGFVGTNARNPPLVAAHTHRLRNVHATSCGRGAETAARRSRDRLESKTYRTATSRGSRAGQPACRRCAGPGKDASSACNLRCDYRRGWIRGKHNRDVAFERHMPPRSFNTGTIANVFGSQMRSAPIVSGYDAPSFSFL